MFIPDQIRSLGGHFLLHEEEWWYCSDITGLNYHHLTYNKKRKKNTGKGSWSKITGVNRWVG